MKKVGIIICDRYHTCAGGKCLRSLKERVGAFARYEGEEVELVGYTTCGGCPGGNVEYAPEEMKNNGAEVVHLATGLVVGYPPCPHLDYLMDLVSRLGLPLVAGTNISPRAEQRRREGRYRLRPAQEQALAEAEEGGGAD